MKSLIVREVLAPLATRVGTALSGYLVGSKLANEELAMHAGAVAAAVLLVSADLVLAAYARYQLKRKIKSEAGQ